MAGGYQKVVMMDLSTSFGLKKNNKLLRIENSVEIVIYNRTCAQY